MNPCGDDDVPLPKLGMVRTGPPVDADRDVREASIDKDGIAYRWRVSTGQARSGGVESGPA